MPTPFTVIGMKDAANNWDGSASIYTSYVKSALLGALATVEDAECSDLEGPNVIPSRHIDIWVNTILSMIVVDPWYVEYLGLEWPPYPSSQARIRFKTKTRLPTAVRKSNGGYATYALIQSGTWSEELGTWSEDEVQSVYNAFVVDVIRVLQSPTGREIVGALYANPRGWKTEIYGLKAGFEIQSWDLNEGEPENETIAEGPVTKSKDDYNRDFPGTKKSERYRIEAADSHDGKGPTPGRGIPVEIYYTPGVTRTGGSSPVWATYPHTFRSDVVLLHELLHAYNCVFGLEVFGKFLENDLSFGPFHAFDKDVNVTEYQVVGVPSSYYGELDYTHFHRTENQYRKDRNSILTPPPSALVEGDGDFPPRTSYKYAG